MGDRFYMQQKAVKPCPKDKITGKRRLKADVVIDIENKLGMKLPGLVKTDMKTLEGLLEGINKC